MAAEEHLSEQFEIVHPSRLVRIGQRTYPAVHTMTTEDMPQEQRGGGIGAKAAWIPMENGQLLRVAHFKDEPGKFYMHAPLRANAGDAAFRGEPHHALPDQYGVMRPFLKVHGAEMASKMIDAESTRPLSDEEKTGARRQLQDFVRRKQ